MARTVLSSIDECIDLINREKSDLETVKEVESTHRELLAIRSSVKDGDADVGADKDEVARWKKLQRITYDAEAAIVNYVLGTARIRAERRGRRKQLLKKCTCWKYFGAHKKTLKVINRISKPIKGISKPIEGIYVRWKYIGAHREIHKEINRISKSIKELKEESKNHYSGGKSFLELSDWNWVRSSVEFDEAEEENDLISPSVVGLKDDINFLKNWLLDEASQSQSVVSVLGIQGIGKTKLAREIYKNSDVIKHFTCKAWVCASAMGDDWSKILEGIGAKINQSQKGERCLIVIDDVSDPKVSSEKLPPEIALHGPGSRIVLTTRNVEVASSANYSHRLKVLSKSDSWELFISKLSIAPWQLGKDTLDQSEPLLPPELEALGREMVEKCGGIPYLIIDLANLLSTKSANNVEWSCVLHGTDTHLSQNQHSWFNLSCFVDDILPSHVKHFLHLFPTGTEIPDRRLFLSWAVEHLWQQSNPGEKVAMRSWWVQDLQDLNLIHAFKVSSIGITKSYRIPPDLPLLQILKAGCGSGGARGSTSSAADAYDDSKVWIHRIADNYESKGPHFRRIHSYIKSSKELERYGALFSFRCFNYPGGYKPGQEVGNFLKRCIHHNHLWFLRVLDLERVYKPRLPKAIGELFNLRYLGLRWTYLDSLPSSIQSLQNLQTLDTKHTDIGYYPRIRYMESLQHLYLNERHQSELVTQLSYLSGLQTLSGVIVDNSGCVKNGLDKLTNLKKLRLTSRLSEQQQEEEALAKWIGELQKLRTLKLTSKDNTSSLLWKKLMMITNSTRLSCIYLQGRLENLVHHNNLYLENLSALTLSLTKLTTDPLPELGKLPNLELLRLFSKSFTGDTMCCSFGMFKQLRVLKIWKLEALEKLTVENGAMPMLEKLEIRSCNKMSEPFRIPKTLLELKLTDMPKEFTSNVMGKDYQNVLHVSSVIIENWSGSNTSIKLYTGQSSVFQGRSLEELLDLDAFKLNLTELTLTKTKLKQDPMPELEKLPMLRTLILSSKPFTSNHMVFSQEWSKELQKLIIQELEELEELIVENGAMPKLEELEISSCKNLKALPQVPGNVKKLKLANMPKEFTEKYKADKRVVVED